MNIFDIMYEHNSELLVYLVYLILLTHKLTLVRAFVSINTGNRIFPGAPSGENREAGVIPARARHCKWGVTCIKPLSSDGKAQVKLRTISQETCLGNKMPFRGNKRG